jgi:hypothetical protein
MYPDYVLTQLGREKQRQFLQAARLEGLHREARASQTPPQPSPARQVHLTFGHRLADWLSHLVARQLAKSSVA